MEKNRVMHYFQKWIQIMENKTIKKYLKCDSMKDFCSKQQYEKLNWKLEYEDIVNFMDITVGYFALNFIDYLHQMDVSPHLIKMISREGFPLFYIIQQNHKYVYIKNQWILDEFKKQLLGGILVLLDIPVSNALKTKNYRFRINTIWDSFWIGMMDLSRCSFSPLIALGNQFPKNQKELDERIDKLGFTVDRFTLGSQEDILRRIEAKQSL